MVRALWSALPRLDARAYECVDAPPPLMAEPRLTHPCMTQARTVITQTLKKLDSDPLSNAKKSVGRSILKMALVST